MPDRRYQVHVHHVGGYGGGIPLAIPPALRGDICLYLYDANAEAMKVVATSSDYRRQVNIGRAVFDREGEVDFHLSYTPSASSLLSLSQDFGAYWGKGIVETDMCDVLTTELREVKTIRVPCTTLDAVARQEGFVDILSIDAEGTEGHIMAGAAEVMKKSVVGLICEVEFVENRPGQTSVGDIFTRTADHGFHLADLQTHIGRFYSRVPIGWRSNGCVLGADLSFYKRLDTIKADHPDAALSLLKLALFSLLTQRLEHGIAAVEAAVALDPDILSQGSDFAYVRLLAEMWDLYRPESGVFLPTWTDFYPTYESGLKHGDADRGIDRLEARRRYFSERRTVGTFLRRLVELSTENDSPLEALLLRYEMKGLATTVKQRRHVSVSRLLHWLGLLESERPTTPETIAMKIAQSLS